MLSADLESTRRVRVAGAGPAGLATAIELAQFGAPVDVYERHPRVGSRFSGDHQVLPAFGDAPNGWALLDVLGVPQDSLSVRPLHSARFVDADDQVVEAHSAEPYALLVRRGPGERTLDTALAARARSLGVRIHTGRALPLEHADVLATGLRRVDGLAMERMFRTSSPDRIDVLLDEDLAPGGYAYLFVDQGEGTLGIAALGAFKDLGPRLDVARDRFAALGAFDEEDTRTAAHGMNFSLPTSAIDDGRPRVGEAAGFQDFLFGLGLRMAILSGGLAARALAEHRDYDALWGESIGARMRTSLVDRWLYERGLVRRTLFQRLGNEDLREVLTALQRDHWLKRTVEPWIRRARLRRDGAGGFVPRQVAVPGEGTTT